MKLYYVDKKRLVIFKVTKVYQNKKSIEDVTDIDLGETIFIPSEEYGHMEGEINEDIFFDYKTARWQLNSLIANKIKELSDEIIKPNVIEI